MNDTDRANIARVAESLTAAWNAGDGTAFARSFSEEADFVNIYAKHTSGRQAVAKQHQMIFDGVYSGSRITFTIAKSRLLPGGAALAQIDAELRVPQGPMAGAMHTLATAVLVREEAGWSITSFHNTREQMPPLPPPN